MEGRNTKFEAYLKENLDKYRGVYVPVRANLLQRLLVQELNCNKIHPNPDDEFCKPEIGPSYEIISRYEEVIRAARMRGDNKPYKEPVIVEKIRPDGYMLLNGHHRWAAAMRMGMKKIPVKVVNMTTESDIHRILNKTTNTKRVTLDLDEVVFAPDGEEGSAEKPLRWPLKKIFRERLRLGMPALFFFLRSHGYDIWVYTAKYYSPEYLHKLFWLYGAHIDGLETGTGRKRRLEIGRAHV